MDGNWCQEMDGSLELTNHNGDYLVQLVYNKNKKELCHPYNNIVFIISPTM